MGSNKVTIAKPTRSVLSLGLSLVLLVLTAPLSPQAQAVTPDLVGSYRILQSRSLALTFTQDYFLQDGQIVQPGQVNRFRVHCQADRGTFDDVFGDVEIFFSTTAAGANRALLQTIPDTARSQSTRIECLSGTAIRGFLDLQVALGRIVELTR